VSKPVRIIPEYFCDDEDLHPDEEFESNFIFVPFENKNVTIYDNNEERKI
jgi:hypothetical protein